MIRPAIYAASRCLVAFLSCLASVVLLSISCSPKPLRTEDDPIPPPHITNASQSRTEEQEQSVTKCYGQFTPPTDNDTYEQEFAFEPHHPRAEEEATHRAREQLLGRLCNDLSMQEDYRKNCIAHYQPALHEWAVAKVDKGVCAFVTLPSALKRQWQELNQIDSIKMRAREVATRLSVSFEPASVRVSLDGITDHGIRGGVRAELIAHWMKEALTEQGFSLREQRDYDKTGWPVGIDIILNGQISDSINMENKRFVNTQWSMRIKRKDHIEDKAIGSFEFLSHLVDAPPSTRFNYIPSQRSNPDGTSSLEVRVRLASGNNAALGGSFCHGDKVFLEVYTDRARHIRLYNLWGKQEGMLLYSGLLEPGIHTLKELEIELSAVPAERFLVVAVERGQESNLEWMAPHTQPTSSDYCRLDSALASQIREGLNIPQNAAAVAFAYRVLGDKDHCGSTTRPPDPSRPLPAWFVKLPLCP